MSRRLSRDARVFLLELVFYTSLIIFAWLDPETFGRVFLRLQVTVLIVLLFVVGVLLRILYVQHRARRVRQRKSAVIIPIRD